MPFLCRSLRLTRLSVRGRSLSGSAAGDRASDGSALGHPWPVCLRPMLAKTAYTASGTRSRRLAGHVHGRATSGCGTDEDVPCTGMSAHRGRPWERQRRDARTRPHSGSGRRRRPLRPLGAFLGARRCASTRASSERRPRRTRMSVQRSIGSKVAAWITRVPPAIGSSRHHHSLSNPDPVTRRRKTDSGRASRLSTRAHSRSSPSRVRAERVAAAAGHDGTAGPSRNSGTVRTRQRDRGVPPTRPVAAPGRTRAVRPPARRAGDHRHVGSRPRGQGGRPSSSD